MKNHKVNNKVIGVTKSKEENYRDIPKSTDLKRIKKFLLSV